MWAKFALLFAGLASVSGVPQTTGAPVAQPDQDAAALAMIDFGQSESRMTVPVKVSERGPFGFVVDTGAERSVISHELANLLALPSGPLVRITSMASISLARTVRIPTMQFGNVRSTDVVAPALKGADVGAPGLLGLDALQDRVLAIDFVKRRMTVSTSKRPAGFGGSFNDIVVVAKRRYGQLIVTDAHCRNIRVAVIVDTGSPISIGNMALRRAMTRAPRSLGPIKVTAVTGDELQADYAVLDRFEVGAVRFNQMAIGFADAPPFHRFHLDDTPAMLLGMDALGLFRHVIVDFRKKTIMFDFPPPETHL